MSDLQDARKRHILSDESKPPSGAFLSPKLASSARSTPALALRRDLAATRRQQEGNLIF